MSTNVSVLNTSECFNCSLGNGTFISPVFLIYVCVVDTFIVLSNIFIAVLIYKENDKVSTSSKLLINQAFADMCTGLTYILTSVFRAFGLDMNLVNRVHSFVLFVFTAESLQLLSASVSCLCFAICYPILFRVYNRTWLFRLITMGTWLVNLAVGSLMFIVSDAFKLTLAFINFSSFKPGSLWYEVVKAVFVFVLPMCGIASFIRVVVETRLASSMGVETQSNTKMLTRKAYAVMAFLSIYWTCLVFTVVIGVVSPLDPDKPWDITDFILKIMYMVLYHGICFKLPIFLFVFKSYRHAARKIFCCSSRKYVSSDSSGKVSSSQVRSTGLDSDSSVNVSSSQVRSTGLDSDSSVNVSSSQVRSTGLDSDSSAKVSSSKVRSTGLDSDSSVNVSSSQVRSTGLDSDSSAKVSSSKVRSIGLHSDSSEKVSASRGKSTGLESTLR